MTDPELVQLATDFRAGILGSRSSEHMCAAVCWPLQGFLSALHGIQTEAAESDLGQCNHVWLLLPDGRALDPTADQFNYLFPDLNMPPVYLGPPTKLHNRDGEAKS